MRRFVLHGPVLAATLGAVLALVVYEPVAAQESSSVTGPSAEKDAAAPSPEIARAEEAILKQDWKTAQAILDPWLANHSQDASGLFDAGYVADAEGRPDDAIALYRKALSANPRSFEAQVSLGLLLARQGRATEARPALEAATAMDPGQAGPAAKARAWRALAEINLAGIDGHRDAAQASIDLLEALKLTPESADDTLLAARIAEAGGETAASESAYRRALEHNPDSAVASAGLAHILITQKKYPEAETLLRSSLQKAPDDVALTAQLAAVLVAEDNAEAMPLLKKLHERHPQDVAISRMLAQVMADAGEFENSDQLYLTLLASEPNDAGLLAGHGQNLIRLHHYPEALKAFTRATELDESNGEAWSGLAFAAFESHQPAVTLHALTVRSKYLPESATIYFLWATAYDTLHDKKQAVSYYRQFLSSAAGKFPDQEWQAQQRLKLLEKAP